MKHRILWITDPWTTLDHPKDTTLRLMEESLSLGIPTHWCDLRTIRYQEREVLLDGHALEGVFPGRKEKDFKLGPAQALAPAHFSQIHFRTDPPVDLAYLHPLQLLQLALGERLSARVVNPLPVLFGCNEKFQAAVLGELMPASIVSSQWETLNAFGQKRGQAVLKPLHEAQSHGVELLSWKTAEDAAHARELAGQLSGGFARPVILQQYLPGIAEGEQRLWFLDGKLLAYARKKPRAGTFKVDMDQGGTLVHTDLDARSRKAAAKIGRQLKRQGIRLAAVDLIEGYVTDFNFTSPGLIVPMEQLLGENLARPILEALTSRSPKRLLVARALRAVRR
jgi:glutathione synthase